MVLTRSEKNRLLSQGIDTDAGVGMMNISSTASEGAVTTTVPGSATAQAQGMTTTTANIAPSVQQFLTMAGGNVSEYRVSDTSISSPEYSSVTARNVRQEFQSNRSTRPGAQGDNINPSAEVIELLREEFSRQMQDFQSTMRQEMCRALGQHQIQSSVANTLNHHTLNNNNPTASFSVSQPEVIVRQRGTSHFQNQAMQVSMGNMQLPRDNNQALSSQPQQPDNNPQNIGPNSPPTPRNVQANCYHPTQNRIDLLKWGIKFDGTNRSMSAEDFMFRLDILRQDYGCSFNDILRSFHLLLEGQALDWYWNVRKLTPIRNWQDLESAFLIQYCRYENEFQIQKRIMDRRQAPQELFEDYYNAIIKLRNQQRVPYSERDLIEIMKSNLKPALSQLLFSVRIEGLNDFCQQARRAESLLTSQRQQHQPRSFGAQRVNELYYEDNNATDSGLEVEALAASNRYTCWNCKQVGHGFMDCVSTIRRIFCYKCGRDGVVTPKCPNCQGNSKLNRPHTGETRSTQT